MKKLLIIGFIGLFNLQSFAINISQVNGKTFRCNGRLVTMNGRAWCNGQEIMPEDSSWSSNDIVQKGSNNIIEGSWVWGSTTQTSKTTATSIVNPKTVQVGNKTFKCNGTVINTNNFRNGQILSASTCDDILLALSCNGKDIINNPNHPSECSDKDIKEILALYKLGETTETKPTIKTRIKNLFS